MSLTKVINIADPVIADQKCVNEAVKVLLRGGLVIVPTETVYGIAANALDKKALEKLYEIKKRPKDKPFALIIAQPDKVFEFAADIPPAAFKLMHKFWPGPLTLLLKGVNQAKVGLRMPDQAVTLEIIRQSGVPLACPSANISEALAPVDFTQAIKDMDGLVDLAIDAGPTKLGQESTIVDLSVTPLQIVRGGAVSESEIISAVKTKSVLFVCTGNSCRSVMAEAYLKKLLAKQKRNDVEVHSAGIMTLIGTGASADTREVLKEEGIDVSGHQSQRVTRELINRSDLILVMERAHEEKILLLAPESENRLFLLKEFAKINDNDLDILDPMGGSFETYESTFLVIKDAVERIMKIL